MVFYTSLLKIILVGVDDDQLKSIYETREVSENETHMPCRVVIYVNALINYYSIWNIWKFIDLIFFLCPPCMSSTYITFYSFVF